MGTHTDPTVPLIKSLILLDSEGKRIAVKYYSQDWYVTCMGRERSRREAAIISSHACPCMHPTQAHDQLPVRLRKDTVE